jgi:hypothetical protein
MKVVDKVYKDHKKSLYNMQKGGEILTPLFEKYGKNLSTLTKEDFKNWTKTDIRAFKRGMKLLGYKEDCFYPLFGISKLV